ncbi:hypothetical protein NDU88_001970 [Pleurodeles waltl]|uniref:Secreted peptide n=1 Tax=Pleurodeles waltl TaxID=8319 RepID=A0AAV7UUD1_PLEWA|nr:hypothetical protein NDU88_001970 [Pleurodeles waltl]
MVTRRAGAVLVYTRLVPLVPDSCCCVVLRRVQYAERYFGIALPAWLIILRICCIDYTVFCAIELIRKRQ